MIQKKIMGGVFILAIGFVPPNSFCTREGGYPANDLRGVRQASASSVRDLVNGGKTVSDIERELLQVSYLRGLYDGLQLANVGWASVYSILNELAGMDLAQLREEINWLYKEYAEMRNNPPAIMILEIIPEARRGVPPAEPGQEKKKEEAK